MKLVGLTIEWIISKIKRVKNARNKIKVKIIEISL